jgi:hypothetical protein
VCGRVGFRVKREVERAKVGAITCVCGRVGFKVERKVERGRVGP